MGAKVLILAACAVVLGGCRSGWSESGPGRSTDTFTYVSTAHQPKTITVTDTRTAEPVWTVEIPAGQQLVIKFQSNDKAKGTSTPDVMRWGLFPAGTRWGTLDERIPVPGPDARRVEMTLREGAEFPAGM